MLPIQRSPVSVDSEKQIEAQREAIGRFAAAEFPLSVQWAITVCKLPATNIPQPLTCHRQRVMPCVSMYSFGLTISVEALVVLPLLLVVMAGQRPTPPRSGR
jgi:hypothetical protein